MFEGSILSHLDGDREGTTDDGSLFYPEDEQSFDDDSLGCAFKVARRGGGGRREIESSMGDHEESPRMLADQGRGREMGIGGESAKSQHRCFVFNRSFRLRRQLLKHLFLSFWLGFKGHPTVLCPVPPSSRIPRDLKAFVRNMLLDYDDRRLHQEDFSPRQGFLGGQEKEEKCERLHRWSRHDPRSECVKPCLVGDLLDNTKDKPIQSLSSPHHH